MPRQAISHGTNYDIRFATTSLPVPLGSAWTSSDAARREKWILLGIYLLEEDVLSLAIGTEDQRPKSFYGFQGQGADRHEKGAQY